MQLANQNDCTACMSCVDICSRNVLKPIIDKDGYFQISIDKPDVCVDCGMCSRTCPILTPIPPDTTKAPKCYAAWAADDNVRAQSASGGVFGAIAKVVINHGGTVYGAAIDGFNVIHRRIDNLESLSLLQGSKYQHSSMESVYKQVRNDLLLGKYVLFSGLSCQVAGLKRFLHQISLDKLFTIDTICGGISTMLPMLNLKNSGRYSAIKSFRDKVNGWTPRGFRYALKMVRTDGTIEDLGLDNSVLNVFSSKLLKRSSCLDCHYNGVNRVSDITIGDFWGNCPHPEQHNKGVSAIVVHNERIMKLIQESCLEIAQTDISTIIEGNHNLMWTKYPMLRRMPMRAKALEALRHDDTKSLNKYIGSHTIPGLILRVYLKLNNLQRRISAK